MIALCSGKSYFLWSDRNEDELDSTVDYLFPLVRGKIDFLLQRGLIITAITTDNATNMINLGTALYQIEKQGKVILHISCSAHTIQLMIEKIVELSPIQVYISAALALLNPFQTKDGKKLRLELRQFQLGQGKETPLKLIQFNQTRWLSRLATLERLVELKEALKFVSLNGGLDPRLELANCKEEKWWQKLKEVIVPLIRCFGKAMNTVQSDQANLIDVNIAIKGIRTAIAEANISLGLGVNKSTETTFRNKSNAIINTYLSSYIAATDHHAYGAVDILTDGSGTDYNANEAEKWIARWGADYLMFYSSHYPHIEITTQQQLVSLIKKQLAEFQTGTNSFSEKSQQLIDFVIETDEKKQMDWKLFWHKNCSSAPELSALALTLLSIGVSEASVERSFSLQALTHSKIRNRMKADIVESEMRIRTNREHYTNIEEEEEEYLSDQE